MHIFTENTEGNQTGILLSVWVLLIRACVRFSKKAGEKTTKICLLYPLAKVVSFSKSLSARFAVTRRFHDRRFTPTIVTVDINYRNVLFGTVSLIKRLLLLDWNTHEPNNRSDENCVLADYRSGYNWIDVSCAARARAICELENRWLLPVVLSAFRYKIVSI